MNKKLKVGDYVKVSGVRGLFKITNIYSDDMIGVYGGTTGREMYRAFTADRVTKRRKPKEIRQ